MRLKKTVSTVVGKYNKVTSSMDTKSSVLFAKFQSHASSKKQNAI